MNFVGCGVCRFIGIKDCYYGLLIVDEVVVELECCIMFGVGVIGV